MGITDSAQVIPTWVMLSQREREGERRVGMNEIAIVIKKEMLKVSTALGRTAELSKKSKKLQ